MTWRRTIIGGCILLATGAMLLALLLAEPLAGYYGLDFSPTPFDSDIWRGSPSDHTHHSIRLRMVDDLLARHSPVGRTRANVVALLGEPDGTTYFSDFDMVYHLGLERGGAFSIDSEWLVLRLDDAGVVQEALLVTD